MLSAVGREGVIPLTSDKRVEAHRLPPPSLLSPRPGTVSCSAKVADLARDMYFFFNFLNIS